MTKIYLDDERSPKLNPESWIIVRSYGELVDKLKHIRLPIDEISFDHDLGGFMTGFDCLKLLIELDINSKGRVLSKDFKYNFHTANPCGRDNMMSYIKSYLKFKES